MKDLKDYLKKKMGEPAEASPEKKIAKMNVLGDLKDAAKEDMADKFGDFQKVSVLAKDKQGLEKGLEKAK